MFRLTNVIPERIIFFAEVSLYTTIIMPFNVTDATDGNIK